MDNVSLIRRKATIAYVKLDGPVLVVTSVNLIGNVPIKKQMLVCYPMNVIVLAMKLILKVCVTMIT